MANNNVKSFRLDNRVAVLLDIAPVDNFSRYLNYLILKDKLSYLKDDKDTLNFYFDNLLSDIYSK